MSEPLDNAVSDWLANSPARAAFVITPQTARSYPDGMDGAAWGRLTRLAETQKRSPVPPEQSFHALRINGDASLVHVLSLGADQTLLMAYPLETRLAEAQASSASLAEALQPLLALDSTGSPAETPLPSLPHAPKDASLRDALLAMLTEEAQNSPAAEPAAADKEGSTHPVRVWAAESPTDLPESQAVLQTPAQKPYWFQVF